MKWDCDNNYIIDWYPRVLVLYVDIQTEVKGKIILSHN
jgi:hypothetical protein